MQCINEMSVTGISLTFSLAWLQAGAYGIQSLGGCLVRGLQGDYFTVMGFPLCR